MSKPIYIVKLITLVVVIIAMGNLLLDVSYPTLSNAMPNVFMSISASLCVGLNTVAINMLLFMVKALHADGKGKYSGGDK